MMVGSDAASAVVGTRAHAAANGVRGCVHTREGIEKEETIEQRIKNGTASIHSVSTRGRSQVRTVRPPHYERLLLHAAEARSILNPSCVVARAHP